MHLPNSKYELIERKIADIQDKIDTGLRSPMSQAETWPERAALRAARCELFALRQIIRDSAHIEPIKADSPNPTDAA